MNTKRFTSSMLSIGLGLAAAVLWVVWFGLNARIGTAYALGSAAPKLAVNADVITSAVKTVSSQDIVSGDLVTYTIVLTAPFGAATWQIDDLIPAGLEFVFVDGATYTEATHSITWAGTPNTMTMQTETFDNVAAPGMPDGWAALVVQDNGGASAWATNAGTHFPGGYAAHSEMNLAYFDCWNSYYGSSARLYRTVGEDWSSLTNAALSFWMFHDDNDMSSDRVQAQVSIDGGANWTNVGAPIYRYSSDGFSWGQHTVDFSAYTGSGMTDVRIGLLGISEYGYDVHLDDIAWPHTSNTHSITLAVRGDTPGSYTNVAEIQNSAGYTITATAPAVRVHSPLYLAKTVTPDEGVAVNDYVTYTLVLSNSDPLSDTAAMLADVLPSQVDFGEWVEQPDSGLVQNGDAFAWTGTLTHSTALTFTFTALYGDNYSTWVTNTATFSSALQGGSAAAGFQVTAYTITPSAGAGGQIAPSDVQSVSEGGDITFAIVPDVGYGVSDVQVDGVSVGAVTTYEFTNVHTNHTIHADFAMGTFIITPTAGAGGRITPGTPQTATYGSDLRFIITPDTGYHTVDVVVDGVSVGVVKTYTFNQITANHTIVAEFAINEYPLVVNVVGNGGVAQIPTWPTYPHGSVVRLVAVPVTGWYFGQWSGDVSGIESSITLTMTASQVVTATFVNAPPTYYTLTLSVDGNGATQPEAGVHSYLAGTVVTLHATPAPGWQFDGWSGDLTGTVNPVQVPLNGSQDVLATFSVKSTEPGSGNWIVVANSTLSNFSIINTVDDVVYGPFLEGQLGTEGGGRFDVDVTPDGQTALISNFGDATIFLVDVSNPIQPSLIVSVTIPFFAEDIDISSDGRYAVVADGGFSPKLATIDIPSATLVYTAELGTASAQGVVVAPDGTVIVPNYFDSAIHSMLMDETGMITGTQTYTYTYPGLPITDTEHIPRPVNIGLAPDGQTVIVCDAATTTVAIFQIVSPGHLALNGFVSGLHGALPDNLPEIYPSPAVQSVAFNAAGTQAYAVINHVPVMSDTIVDLDNDRLGILDITGPGEVSLAAGGVVTLPHHTGSQLFGVDVVAVADNKVYVGYPTLSSGDELRPLAIVNLDDYSVTSTMVFTAEVSIPVGLAVLPLHLEPQMTVSDPTPAPGQLVTYTLTLTNTGPQITRITLRDVLPEGVEFVGPITLSPSDSGVVGSALPELVTDLVIPAYQRITVTFPVRVKTLPHGTEIYNVIVAESPELSTAAIAQHLLVIENIAPVLNTVGNQTTTFGDTLTFTATASDANNDPLIYTLDAGSVGSITSDGVFTWTPTKAEDPGVYTVTVRVSDGDLEDSETFTIIVGGGQCVIYLPLIYR